VSEIVLSRKLVLEAAVTSHVPCHRIRPWIDIYVSPVDSDPLRFPVVTLLHQVFPLAAFWECANRTNRKQALSLCKS